MLYSLIVFALTRPAWSADACDSKQHHKSMDIIVHKKMPSDPTKEDSPKVEMLLATKTKDAHQFKSGYSYERCPENKGDAKCDKDNVCKCPEGFKCKDSPKDAEEGDCPFSSVCFTDEETAQKLALKQVFPADKVDDEATWKKVLEKLKKEEWGMQRHQFKDGTNDMRVFGLDINEDAGLGEPTLENAHWFACDDKIMADADHLKSGDFEWVEKNGVFLHADMFNLDGPHTAFACPARKKGSNVAIIIIFVVLVLVAAGVGGYFFMQKSKPLMPPTSTALIEGRQIEMASK